jgi:hypothetical protein
MVHHGERFSLLGSTVTDEQKMTHLVIRIYGGLITAQAWIVWSARATADAGTRRALVQAYTLAFAVTTLALLRAQLTEGGGMNGWNWLNIAGFGGLTGVYAYYAFVERIAVFEGLGKALG